MRSGAITGNTRTGNEWCDAGGVGVDDGGLFTMQGGTIYGKAAGIPAGTDAKLANSTGGGASLDVYKASAKWGTGGTYSGGENQTGGGDIVS